MLSFHFILFIIQSISCCSLYLTVTMASHCMIQFHGPNNQQTTAPNLESRSCLSKKKEWIMWMTGRIMTKHALYNRCRLTPYGPTGKGNREREMQQLFLGQLPSLPLSLSLWLFHRLLVYFSRDESVIGMAYP